MRYEGCEDEYFNFRVRRIFIRVIYLFNIFKILVEYLLCVRFRGFFSLVRGLGVGFRCFWERLDFLEERIGGWWFFFVFYWVVLKDSLG